MMSLPVLDYTKKCIIIPIPYHICPEVVICADRWCPYQIALLLFTAI